MNQENLREIDITEIEGFELSNFTDLENGTGVTGIISREGMVASVDIRGGGPATRETDCLRDSMLINKIHGLMLSGGSAYGLEASSGLMQYLEEENIGFDAIGNIVPIVSSASLFDLTIKQGKIRPDKKMGYMCFKERSFGYGSVGCGTGATIGKIMGVERSMKGGLGGYAVQVGDIKCGAIVAVNALGDVYSIDTGKRIAGLLSEDKKEIISTEDILVKNILNEQDVFKSGNTTIGAILTNANISKSDCKKLAKQGQNGIARTIRPVHTDFDGDSIFALASGRVDCDITSLSVLASYVMSKAVNVAIKSTGSMYGVLGYLDR